VDERDAAQLHAIGETKIVKHLESVDGPELILRSLGQPRRIQSFLGVRDHREIPSRRGVIRRNAGNGRVD
jgi:hypothetical protein